MARPVLPSPGAAARSSTASRHPRSARWQATLAPTTPPPTTTTSGALMPGAAPVHEHFLFPAVRLELERVAGGIAEEHRHLLAGLAGVPQARLDDEGDAAVTQPLGEAWELVPRQHRAEVRHRYGDFVDLPVLRVAGRPRRGSAEIWLPKKSKSTQVRCCGLRGNPELAVEATRLGEVADVEGVVERLGHGALVSEDAQVAAGTPSAKTSARRVEPGR